MKKKILISYVSYSNTSKSVAYNIYDKLDKKKYIVSLIDLSEYGSKINMFKTEIPVAVSTAESPSQGESIFEYDPKSTVSEAYRKFAKEVLKDGTKEKHRLNDIQAR